MLDLLSEFRALGYSPKAIADQISDDDVVMVCVGLCVVDDVVVRNNHHLSDFFVFDSHIIEIDNTFRRKGDGKRVSSISRDAMLVLVSVTNEAIAAGKVRVITAISRLVGHMTEVVD